MQARSASDDGALRLAVIGDRTDEPNDAAWRQVLREVEALQPDLIVTVGGLADDATDPSDWDRALEPFADLSIRVEFTPGNHDILDAETERVFRRRTGQAPYRSFDSSGVHFVIVDNSIADDWGQLSEAQRRWLAEDLSQHVGRPILVFMHKPFWVRGIAKGEPDPMHSLFVEHGVRAVFSGHWHNHAYQRIEGIDYVLVGTSGGAFSGVPDRRLGNVHEFIWATVRSGDLSMAAVTAEGVLPIDYLSLRDARRLGQLLKRGGVTATLPDTASGATSTLEFHVADAALLVPGSRIVLDPGAWSAAQTELTLDARSGSWSTGFAVRRMTDWLPLPRLRFVAALEDAGPVPAEIVASYRREIRVPRTRAPRIDGRVDPDEWSGAVVVGQFTNGLGLSSESDATEVLLAHDGEALYLAARCRDDTPGGPRRNHHGRDGEVVYDDRVGLTLSPDPQQLYWFYVNPNGAVWDLHSDRAAQVVDRGWDATEASAQVHDGGWTAEVRLEFAALGLDAPPDTLRFDFRRKHDGRQAEATWTPAFSATDPARMGILAFE